MSNIRKVSIALLGILFVLAGVNHFRNPDFYVNIMPPYLPIHVTLVYVSGFFEILGGVGVLTPQLRQAAGWGLVVLLIAVFPANLHMAIQADDYLSIPLWLLVARLPLQFVLIAWVWWSTISHDGQRSVPTES